MIVKTQPTIEVTNDRQNRYPYITYPSIRIVRVAHYKLHTGFGVMINDLTKAVLESQIRHMLTVFGTYLVTQGVVTSTDANGLQAFAEPVTGLVLLFAAFGWSVLKNFALAGHSHQPKNLMKTLDQSAKPNDAVSDTKAAKYQYHFGRRSTTNLEGVHPALVALCRIVIARSPIDFVIIDGVRTADEQLANIRRGVSWTANSKHLIQKDGFSHAIDFAIFKSVNNEVVLDNDLTRYKTVADIFKSEAARANLSITWGGDWQKRDGMHIQLNFVK